MIEVPNANIVTFQCSISLLVNLAYIGRGHLLGSPRFANADIRHRDLIMLHANYNAAR